MMQFAFVAGGFAAGFVLAWFLGSRARELVASSGARLALLEPQLSAAVHAAEIANADLTRLRDALRAESSGRAAAEAAANRVPSLELELQSARGQLAMRQAEVSELQARGEEQARAADEKLRLLNESQLALENSFKALSAKALENSNASFLQLATASLERFQEKAQGDLEARNKAVEALVTPIRESLHKVDGKLGEIEKTRDTANAALNEQLRGLVETQAMLRTETAGLVKALRQPSERGRWGEMQLQRVVEMAGMVEHCDFVEQPTGQGAEGRLRPDLIVRLAGGKQIIVDAKAPLEAYLEASQATDDQTRQLHLVRHAQQVRAHMSALGRKAYWEAFTSTPELVVMFVPGEGIYSAALQQDSALLEFGVNERVVIATPTTLIALLRTVAYGWRQEALALNAQEVAALGKQMFERIATLTGHWADVGDRLGKAVAAYNSSVSSMERRVLPSARRFRDLEAAPADAEIPLLEPIEVFPRALSAPELLPSPELAVSTAPGPSLAIAANAGPTSAAA